MDGYARRRAAGEHFGSGMQAGLLGYLDLQFEDQLIECWSAICGGQVGGISSVVGTL
jgi:hypothetical protein